MSAYIIAELGSTWERDKDLALAGIRLAAAAGANAVKFQWTGDPKRMAQRRNAPELEDKYGWYLNWDAEWHDIFGQACTNAGVDYMCTVYVPEDIPTIRPYVSSFKVASFECRNNDLLRAYCGLGQRVIVSLGLCAYETAVALKTAYPHYAFLYCVSAYPTPNHELFLRRMAHREDSPYSGVSDHTTSLLTGACAVALRTPCIIEKHMRLLDTAATNPDYSHSLPPDEFGTFVKFTREAELLLHGAGFLLYPASQEPNRRFIVKGNLHEER